MDFKQIFKTTAISLIILTTLLMVVISPVAAVSKIVGREMVTADLKPGSIGPIDPIVVPDTTAPVTRLECLIDGVRVKCDSNWGNKEVTVKFVAIDAESKTVKTYFRVEDAKEDSKDIGPEPVYFEGKEVKLSSEGIHTIKYYSVDESGNKEATKEKEMKLDFFAPSTRINAPSDVQEKAFEVSFTARDELSGVKSTFYSLDGGKSFTEASSFTISNEGKYAIQYYSVDEAGNTEEVATKSVELDLPSSGGSSDGSSSSSYTLPSYQSKTYILTEEQLKMGYSLVLFETDVVKFFKGNTEYTVTVKDVTYGKEVVMTAFGKDIKFSQSQSQTFDVDADEKEDLTISVGNAYTTSTVVTFQSVKGESVIVEPEYEEEVGEDDEDNEEIEVVVTEDKSLFTKIMDSITSSSLPIKVGFVSLTFVLITALVILILLKE